MSNIPIVIGTDGSKKEIVSDEDRLFKIKQEKKRLENEIKEIKKEIQTLKTKSQIDADSILSDAKEKASRLLSENSEKCNKALEEANKKKEMIFSESKESGYSQGYEEGKEKAKQDINVQMKDLIKELQDSIETINSERDKIFLSLKDDVARLIMSYVKKIIKLELKIQPEIILANIEKALNEISSKDSITIILSREDIALVEDHSDDIKNSIRGLKNLRFLREPYISKGGCEIETDYGSIDATIESQLFELEKLVLNDAPEVRPDIDSL